MTMADMTSARDDGEVGAAGGPRSDRPTRRNFTAAYKLKIVEEYDQLTDPSERGALLRREGLYHSSIQKWRAARDQGALEALADKPAGRPVAGKGADNERLRRENERLAAELARAKAALDIVGKAHALLGLLSESADSAGKSTK